jgi:dihydrofolate reductase
MRDGIQLSEAISDGAVIFRHACGLGLEGIVSKVCGRVLYEVMRYWNEDHPEWNAADRDFAAAWRSQPKWVVSRSLRSVGPNATLINGEVEAVVRGLKAEFAGEIDVGGPDLARSLTALGLIDEYRLYLHVIPRRMAMRLRVMVPF